MNDLKVYIKMCGKAIELQKSWKPRVGDLVWRGKEYLPIPDACGYLTDVDIFDTQGYKKNGAIWLPSQSQLQEMVIEKWKKGIKEGNSYRGYPISFIEDFNQFIRCQIAQKYNCVDWSMEQLWLAFVMKEKYNKVWNGEDWVK